MWSFFFLFCLFICLLMFLRNCNSFYFLLNLEFLIREKLMSGKLLIEWRHDLCAEIVKKRYINDQEILHSAHAEIVSLFFPLETSDESDDINSETSEKSCKYKHKYSINIIFSIIIFFM